MNRKTQNGMNAQHAFFHTMVLMGGSLAVNCGGVTSDGNVTSSDKNGVDAGGGSASSFAGGAAGSSGSGGTGSGATGGITGFPSGTGATTSNGAAGGIGGAGTGGTALGTGAQPATDAGAYFAAGSCPSTQWSCTSYEQCAGEGSTLPSGCTCDPSRPKSASDCQPAETFACRIARYGDIFFDGGYLELADPVLFECACVPHQMDCNTACLIGMTDYADGWDCTSSADAGIDEVLCECAWVFLR